MMKLYTRMFFSLGATILFGLAGFGQGNKVKKADKKYEQAAFIDAIDYYLQAAEKGYRSEQLFSKLGNAYYFNADYNSAGKWYKELFVENPDPDPIYELRYAQCLLSMGDREKAKMHYDSFMSSTEHKPISIRDAKQQIKANSGRYELKLLNINSSGVDFGGTVIDNKLVFASSRDHRSIFQRKSTWDGLSFLDLYEASFNGDGTLDKPTKLKGKINSIYHESTAAFSKDGNTIYFTRNTEKPKDTSNDKILRLKIFRAHLEKGKWTDVEELSINGENFSTAHPALNFDNTRLYFVSDRPESIGGTDIFYASILPDGSLGEVISLGNTVNTIGRESFPYLTMDNELYFSSDGHYGLGGYDVFYSTMDDMGAFKAPINVGEPVNSSFDDVCFVIEDHKGFVSSNRSNGTGYDDIYSFTELKDVRELLKSKIYGVVTDKQTKEVIPNATITITDKENTVITTLDTDNQGHYEKEVDLDTDYILKATKPKFEGDEAYSNGGVAEREHNFELIPRSKGFLEGDDIIAKLHNIVVHFDLDKSNIRPDAALELDKLVRIMKEYPNLNIKAECHTDSRANDAYNLALSQRRAKSIVDYMVDIGISKDRISGKGFGETQLVNQCGNNINCTEKQHQENRRGEFKIESID